MGERRLVFFDCSISYDHVAANDLNLLKNEQRRDTDIEPDDFRPELLCEEFTCKPNGITARIGLQPIYTSVKEQPNYGSNFRGKYR